MRSALLGVVLLVGCGGGSDDPPPAKSKPAPEAAKPDVTAEAQPAPEPPGPAFAREAPHVGDSLAMDPKLARERAIEEARNVGILGATALGQGGAFQGLTTTGDISSGFDDSTVYGGLTGSEVGEMNGGFGFGRSGIGPGGGGTGTIGALGHGAGTGTGYGVGGGRGALRGGSIPVVSVGATTATGNLDKAVIRRYLKRNIAKIQYCYEKELRADPKLAGTVALSFTIAKDGTVAGANGTGVSAAVASCVADVVRTIEFPRPKDGTVDVAQPFTFRRVSP